MALYRARAASSILLRSILHAPTRSLSSVYVGSDRVASCELELRCYRGGGVQISVLMEASMSQMLTLDIRSQIGSCRPLANMRIRTQIHNIELRPGQGGKLVRAAGTSAKILTEPNRATRYCEIKLPSGVKTLIDTRCRATIGMVSNPEKRTKKLRKARQSRWLGRRPVVRGVAMNPVDHPHGGGEGRSKSSGSHGRLSCMPWGKPTKGGYKTARPKRKI